MGGRKSEITDRQQDVKDIGLDWLDMGDVTLLTLLTVLIGWFQA